jgi:hypothetical protein
VAIISKPKSKPLRLALEPPKGLLIFEHRDHVEAVRKTHPHVIRFRELINQSTCVLYALGLARERAYRAIALDFDGAIFAGKTFMQWLVSGRHLIELDKPKMGCLALYFDNGVWQHIGIVTGPRRVISQWGEFPVYEHDVCEVPARYGDEVRYFEMLDPGEPLRLFLAFAKTQGISDADLAEVIKA